MSKTPSECAVVMTEIVLPQHTNAIGSIFGGVVMSWIDIAGAICSGRHARSQVVTASIDALHFIAPIKLGHFVHLQASVNYAGKTSMEIGVKVESEEPLTGRRFHNVSAYLTFVAVDSNGRPCPVPALEPQTETEKRRHQAAIKRRASRVQLAESLKNEDKNS